MKVALISTFFHPVTGGVESHVYSLAKNLIDKGHDVEVLCSDSTKIGPRLKEKKSIISGIHVRRFFTWISLSYYHKFNPGIFFYLLKHDFDVIHVHGFRTLATYMAMLAGRIKHKKVILTTHNPFPTSSRSKGQNILIKLHDVTFGKWFTKKLHYIIALVNSEKDILVKKFNVQKEKIIVIPNGIDDRFYEVGDKVQFYKEWDIKPEKWQGIVLAAGRINYVKGYQNLHPTVKSLPKVLFFIAGGDDGYLEKLKVLYADCPNIIFSSHFMSAEKLINMYAGGTLFLFPSLHEAFGLVLLEALAQGLPVLSTNIGGPADFITKEVGILISPTDAGAWTDNIRALLKDSDKLGMMSQNAREFAKKYSWSKLTPKILKIYKS